MSGAELTQIIDELIAAPQELRDRVKLAIQPRDAKQIPAKKGDL